jgi:hypothetical protein
MLATLSIRSSHRPSYTKTSEAIRIGEKEPAKGGRFLYRLNLEFKRTWDGRYYGVQQVAPVVKDEEDEIVVITVYTSYF